MIGQTIAQYRIDAKIGKGGMGVVYRAQDTRLDRTVALKFLPRESLDGSNRARFVQEARTAARLSHPNICPVYELVESGEDVCFAMALLEGETLAERIGGGPLPLGLAVTLAIQIASGLEEAHRNGVVHRDVKSANVIVNAENHAYILDFGLSLLSGVTRMTVPGTVAGTPSYMAPEQATGREVDQRADVWALGVVLYEMLTGRRPFDRDRDVSTLYAIVHEEAPEMAGVPEGVRRVVARALAKDVGDRYQSAREMAEDLRRMQEGRALAPTVTQIRPLQTGRRGWMVWAAVAVLAAAGGVGVWQKFGGPEGEKRIAILPFEVIGGGEETRAISDGLVDTLTSRLSETESVQKQLLIVPASEIRSRKITSAEEARRVYGATLVVTGSVQGGGETTLFNVNLVDAVTMRQLGSRSFSFDAKNPIGIRKEALGRLLSLLNVQLANAAAEGETSTPGAYAEYLKARGFMARYDVAGNLDRAIESYQAATQLDGKYALAFTGLAEAAWRKATNTGEKQWAERAVGAAEQAVRLDAKLAVAQARLGEIYAQSGRREEAIGALRTALQLEPANAEAHRGLAGVYTNMGRFAEAEEAYLQVTRFRPTDWYAFLQLGVFYWDQNRYAEAEAALQNAAKLAPNNEIVYRNLAGLNLVQGKYGKAREQVQIALKLKPSARSFSLLGLANYFERKFAEAASALEAAVELDGNYYVGWGNLGSAYRWVPGSEAKAKAALTRAVGLAEKRLAVTPEDNNIRANLAEYRAKLGDKKGAVAEIERIPVANRGAYWGRIAMAYELAGERARAVETVLTALGNSALLSEIKDEPDMAAMLKEAGLGR
jgi:serine/threonine-protein kinase